MSNPFNRKFTEFAQKLSVAGTQHKTENLAETANEVYVDKPFTVEFSGIYTVAKVGQTVTQVVTFCTTAALGVFALLHIIPTSWGIYFAVPVAFLFAFGVEKVKRETLSTAAKYYLKYKQLGVVGVAAGLVMCVSIAAALYGAKKLPDVVYPEPEIITDGSTVVSLTADIEKVQKDIERTTVKLNAGDNWTAENRTLPRLQKERAKLVEQRTEAEKQARERGDHDHQKAIEARAKKVDELQIYSVSVAVIAELIFLFCTAFILYYLFRQYAETQVEQEPQQEIPAKQAIAGKVFTANLRVDDNRLTKIVAGMRECKHCGKEYEYRHAKQIYCSDDCRIIAWQERTGGKVRKGMH